MIHFTNKSKTNLTATVSNPFQRTLAIGLFLGAFLLLSLPISAQPGTIQWEENYGGSQEDEANHIQVTDDGGYIVAGASQSGDGDVSGNNGGPDYWVVKLDGSGNIEWEGNYGGSDWDVASSVQQTDDGGYIVAGYSQSSDGDVSVNNGNQDYWVVKLNGSGNIEWEESYGGSDFEQAKSIQQTNDGGYIVAGQSLSDDLDLSGNNGGRDYWVVKLDGSGNIEWEGNYGGSGSDVAKSIQITADGGYIVAGHSSSNDGDVTNSKGFVDYWVIKLDSTGGIEWKENYGGSDADQANAIQATDDGGYIVAGGSNSSDGDLSSNNGGIDYWIVKLDSSGGIEWEGNHGGSFRDEPQSIHQTVDGGYIVAGTSMSDDGDVSGNNGNQDYWFVKLDGSGAIDWEENYGGIAIDNPGSAQQTDDGGYIVAGTSESSDGDVGGNQGLFDTWIVKLEGAGTTGVSEDKLAPELSLYPNPTREDITVKAPEAKSALTAIVRDITGNELSRQRIEEPSRFQVQLGEEAGLYMLELEDAEGNRTVRKVVKE